MSGRRTIIYAAAAIALTAGAAFAGPADQPAAKAPPAPATAQPPAPAPKTDAPAQTPAAAAEPAPASQPSAPPVKAEAKAAPAGGAGWSFTGVWTEEFRARHSSGPDQDDQDARFYTDMTLTDPTDRFSATAATGLWWDVDGVPRSTAIGFKSIRDTRDPALWVDVYKLYAEYRGAGMLKLARAGRQEAAHGEPEVFDGATVEFRPVPPLTLFAFGGEPEYFYTVESGVFKNWLGSAGAEWRPAHSLKLEADYRLIVEEVTAGFQRQTASLTAHTYGLSAMFRHDEWLKARAFVRGIDATLAKAGAAAGLENHERLIGAELKVEAQTVTLNEINEGNDPYYLILGKSLPNLKWRLDAWKGWQTGAGLYAAHLGYEGRQLIGESETAFNRNVGRLYAMLSATDIGTKGPFCSVTLERNGVTQNVFNMDGLFAVGGALGWDRGIARAEAGTYYQRFKYDYYRSVQEVTDVRVYYGDLRIRIQQWLAARARYSLEVFDRELHTFTLGLTQAY